MRPNINVTPLVDVVLVLLIIFMVIIPNLQDGKPIEMVKVSQADTPKDGEDALVVTLDAEQRCTLGDDDLGCRDLIDRLHAAYSLDGGRKVVLRADARLPYKSVRELFAEIRGIGFSRVALAVGVAREWSEN